MACADLSGFLAYLNFVRIRPIAGSHSTARKPPPPGHFPASLVRNIRSQIFTLAHTAAVGRSRALLSLTD